MIAEKEFQEAHSIKKKLFVIAGILCILAATYFIGSGFQKRTDVILRDYSVSEDGTSIRFEIQVASSMGYVREFRDHGSGVKPHYLTFYQTFGGFNSAFGAKDTFVLEVEPEDTEIYFDRPNGGSELVLQRDVAGQWIRPGK